MEIKPQELRTRPLWVLATVACLILTTAFQGQAQAPLSSLSDTELIALLHQQDAREELRRRLETYSPERRKALTLLLENRHISKKFPIDYADDELYVYLHKPADFRAYSKAQDELARRFEVAPPEEQRQYTARLRQELLAVPYPEPGERDAEAETYWAAHRGLTLAMGKILPEADAVGIFYEAYISNARTGGISRFLQAIEAAQVCGPSTARTLEALYKDVSVLDQRAREELGEWQGNDWPPLESMIVARLPCCGAEGFRVLCGLEWEASPAGILAMGAVGTPEARDMLVELYEQTAPGHYSTNLVILQALSVAHVHAPDETTRLLLQTELMPLLHLPEDLPSLETCRTAAGIAAISRDSEFLRPLRQLLTEVEQASVSGSLPANASGDTLERFRRSIEESLRELETAIQLVPIDSTAR